MAWSALIFSDFSWMFISYVIAPYNEYPPLLGLLLKLLNGELEWSTRLEVLKVFIWLMHCCFIKKQYNALVQEIRWYILQVLGIMGALDPHAHKRNQHKPGQHREVLHSTVETAQHIVSMEEAPTDSWPSFSASEDYYSTVWFCVTMLETWRILVLVPLTVIFNCQVAISSLMRILRDPSLASYHQMVVGSLIFVFKVIFLFWIIFPSTIFLHYHFNIFFVFSVMHLDLVNGPWLCSLFTKGETQFPLLYCNSAFIVVMFHSFLLMFHHNTVQMWSTISG